MKTIVSILLFFAVSLSFGQQLTYTPKNPNFGGNTFNYSWLLSSAEAQNSFTDPNEEDDGKNCEYRQRDGFQWLLRVSHHRNT